MLRHSRLMFVSFLLMLSLIVPANVAQAQSSPQTKTRPQAPTDINVAPSTDLAVPDEVAQVTKLRASLTADQVSKMQAIVTSHEAELQQITNELGSPDGVSSTQNKKLFLPFIGSGDNSQSQAKTTGTASASKSPLAKTAEELSQINLRLLAVQDKIDQEMKSVLTTSQSEVYAKQAAKMKSAGKAIAAKLKSLSAAPSGAEGVDDCFYGAKWASYGNYYAYYGYYYSYLNYYTYFTSNGYYAYLYAYYSYYYYTGYALSEAASAYFDVAYGFYYDSNNSSDDAASDLYGAYYYSFYSKYYASVDYNNTLHGYAYYTYYYEYYATYWLYQAFLSESSCS